MKSPGKVPKISTLGVVPNKKPDPSAKATTAKGLSWPENRGWV